MTWYRGRYNFFFHFCILSILQMLPYDMKSWKTAKRIRWHGMCLVAGYKTMTPNSFCCFSTFHMAYGISYGNFCKKDSSCHGLYLPLLDNIKQLWIWFVIIHKFHCQRISWLIHRFLCIREICCQCWMSNKSPEIDLTLETFKLLSNLPFVAWKDIE